MYDEILLPTDGSLGMANAIRQCLYQARQADARVHVLYVVDVRSYVMLPDDTQEQVANLLEEEGRRAVEMVEHYADDDELSVVGQIRRGVPVETILEYVDDVGIDLVVMGTHGRSKEEQAALGSVAQEVVRWAEVPVLTARMREADAEALLAELPEEERPRYIR
jgi:nucleotide-binding universal stress UspA family protein